MNLVQRKHNYAIVDEVDSVLIDDASTPLIISGPVQKAISRNLMSINPRLKNYIMHRRIWLQTLLLKPRNSLQRMNLKMKERGELLFRAYKGLAKKQSLDQIPQ